MVSETQKGKEVNRLEGRLKVTGAAKYAGEYEADDLLYGYVVNSTITKGKIKGINTDDLKLLPGIVKVFTHENRPSTAMFELQYTDMDAPPGKTFKPLDDNKVYYNGQPIALVVADSFEVARLAASLLKIEYETEEFDTCLDDNLDKARDQKKGIATFLFKPPPPKPTGDFEKAYQQAEVKAEAEFRHSTEHHNPMEMFATTTIYEGDGKLTIYDKTQGTNNSQIYVANVFGLHFKNVTVRAPFVGGGFGSGLRPQYQLFLCVMAALDLKRNVKLTLDRKQMFTFGHRPQTIQHTRFASDANGKLTALGHKAFAETSQFEDYTENVVGWSHSLYPADNTLLEHKLVPMDVYTPLDMRAPGGCTGIHAIESTMDELAEKLNIDPVELRLINYAEESPAEGKPFTSKELKQCYLKGAEKFGWSKRNPKPGSMTRGNKLVGYGMATGIWDAMQMPSRIQAKITRDGKLEMKSAVTDIGVGSYTAMTQIAADELGLPIEDVNFLYGDSDYPLAFIQGGSFTTASVGAAIVMVAKKLKAKVIKAAKKINNSLFKGVDDKDIVFKNGKLMLKDNPSVAVSLTDVIASNKGKEIQITGTGHPHALKLRKYSKATHSAAFVEVEIDKDLKTINVTRALTAVAAGNIINPKTARSQILGGMVWSISKALKEETLLDENLGKYMNANLAEYHIPVHADIHELDVIFAEENDTIINELGCKGVGEIGLVAMPAAIANAIYHATGKRVNKFPIHFNELL